MTMTNLKISKKYAKKSSGLCSPIDREEDRYPYGLRIDLDSDTLDKLGIKSMPAVGETIVFEAKATVIGSRQSAIKDSMSRSVELQITEIDLEDLQEEEDEGEITRDKKGPASRLADRMKDM